MEFGIGNSSAGGISDPAIEEKLQALRPQPLDEQLRAAGFQPAASQNPSKSVFRLQDPTNPEAEILAVTAPDDHDATKLEAFFEPITDFGMGKLIAGSRIIGTGTAADWRGNPVPSLRLTTGALEYSITTANTTQPTEVEMVREMTPEELGIQRLPEYAEPTGFVVGGTNDTELIKSLPSIAGKPIPELAEKMRPQVISEAGFLGHEDDLLATMARDNDTVRQGRTHPSGLSRGA